MGTPAHAAAPGARVDGLDVPAVDRWLRALDASLEGPPDVTRYSGGASNWTYRLRYRHRDLVLRRPPDGTKAKSAHDMAREYRVQHALRPSFPLVPAMVALCQDPAVIGVDFYVMERIDGLVPRRRLPPGVELGEEQVRRLCTRFVDTLADLHRVDVAAAGLGALGKGPGYPRRQVEGWTERYARARTWNVPSFAYVCAWLRERTPSDAGACIVHNDWRFDNVVLDPADPTRIAGVLDWEMATVGDPLMELGSALAYWVESSDDVFMRFMKRQPTDLPGMMRRTEVVEHYLGRTGLRPDDWTFYEVFGLFRLAVIAQQIYYRYHHKQARDPAFRHFWLFVHYFDRRCRRLIGRSSRG